MFNRVNDKGWEERRRESKRELFSAGKLSMIVINMLPNISAISPISVFDFPLFLF